MCSLRCCCGPEPVSLFRPEVIVGLLCASPGCINSSTGWLSLQGQLSLLHLPATLISLSLQIHIHTHPLSHLRSPPSPASSFLSSSSFSFMPLSFPCSFTSTCCTSLLPLFSSISVFSDTDGEVSALRAFAYNSTVSRLCRCDGFHCLTWEWLYLLLFRKQILN